MARYWALPRELLPSGTFWRVMPPLPEPGPWLVKLQIPVQAVPPSPSGRHSSSFGGCL